MCPAERFKPARDFLPQSTQRPPREEGEGNDLTTKSTKGWRWGTISFDRSRQGVRPKAVVTALLASQQRHAAQDLREGQ